MSFGNGKNGATPDVVTAQVAAAACVARALVVGFDACEQSGMPLSQLQKIAMIEGALLEFDGFEAHLGVLADVSKMLRELGPDGQQS